MNEIKEGLARQTNRQRQIGSLAEVIDGADVFIGLSKPGVLTEADVQRMARDPVVFALANPTPEIPVEDAAPYARVIATGRSDYPNQINNVLAFPGVFRGALDCRAREINLEMKVAAARAINGLVSPDELAPDFIIPSVFDPRVASAVAVAVAEAAERTGVARQQRGGLICPSAALDSRPASPYDGLH